LDETTTSRFSAKKLTLVRKRFHMLRISWKDFEEVLDIYDAFASDTAPDRFTRDFWLGKLAIEETIDNDKRTITFSPF
jgi:hypothetical protein